MIDDQEKGGLMKKMMIGDQVSGLEDVLGREMNRKTDTPLMTDTILMMQIDQEVESEMGLETT